MKKTAFILTMMVSTAFARTGRYPPAELEVPVKQVICLTELTPQITKELFKGIHPNVAFKCEEGIALPLKYLGNFGLFSINFSPNLSFKVEKTCYLRFIKKKTFLSFDLKQWEKASSFVGNMANTNAGVSPDFSHILVETKSDVEFSSQKQW